MILKKEVNQAKDKLLSNFNSNSHACYTTAHADTLENAKDRLVKYIENLKK